MNEMTPYVMTFLCGLLLGLLILYYIYKTSSVSIKVHDKIIEENQSLHHQLEQFQKQLSEEQVLNRGQEQQLLKLATERKTIESRLHEEKEVNTKQQARLDTHMKEIIQLKTSLSELSTLKNILEERLQEQREEQKKEREKALVEYENITSRLLRESTERLTQKSTENLTTLLTPLKENISEFKKQVADVYDKESKERFSLENSIKSLVDLNHQISQDANNLTNALKGKAKTQGDWGEMILENILEQSGLVKNREYFTQESYTDDEGNRKQPDVKIKYPDNRYIIVDSKVSLTAYERYANCEDVEEQKNQLNLHIRSVRNHIENLSSKQYDKFDKTLDFVMLFVPIEPAYMLAIQHDAELWAYAYKKKILLISPTNLIAALKMVADIWKRENQSANVLKIVERGNKLYEKFVGFVKDMEEIDKHLNRASSSYTSAMNKLTKGNGNLIGQAEKLKSMGLNTDKEIPEKFRLDNDA